MSGHRTFHVLDAVEASPARTRRIWSKAAKELILAEANVPGANVSAVARAHDVSVHQLFRWRREARMAAKSATSRTGAGASTEPPLTFIAMAPASETKPAAPISAELCEIVVAGVVLRIGPGIAAHRVVELIRAARLA
jgi:transposase